MMHFDRMVLGRQARELGFVRDTFEKICRLADVLKWIHSDSFLAESVALKGGTALNLMILDLPRLSVDIDLDFVHNLSRDEMMKSREVLTNRIKKYMSAAGYTLGLKSKTYHALDSFVFEYQNAGGMKDNIKIEITYMLRCHILPPVVSTTLLPWNEQQLSTLCLDPIEIYASKIVAMLNRAAPRDLFDESMMIQEGCIKKSQEPLLRKCVMFYCAVGSDKVPEQFNVENTLSITQQRIKTDLVPVLRNGTWFDAKQAYGNVAAFLHDVLVPTPDEFAFWSAFSKNQYEPKLLFDDPSIVERLHNHPMAIWKCRGIVAMDTQE